MIVEGRRQVLLDFFGAHPERFVNGAPKPPEIPSAAWINPPTTKTTHQIGAQAVSEASDDLQVPLICNIYGEPVVSNSAASVTRTQHNHAQNSGKPGVTVRPPSAAHGSLHGRRHISGCSLNTRSRCLKIIDNYRSDSGSPDGLNTASPSLVWPPSAFERERRSSPYRLVYTIYSTECNVPWSGSALACPAGRHIAALRLGRKHRH